jgi:hypothetical protein
MDVESLTRTYPSVKPSRQTSTKRNQKEKRELYMVQIE